MFRVGGSVRGFDGLRTRGLRIGPKSTSAVISAAAVRGQLAVLVGAPLFQDNLPGITYASLIRNRDSRLVPRTDGLVEILSPPEAKPVVVMVPWVAACFGSESRLHAWRIDHLMIETVICGSGPPARFETNSQRWSPVFGFPSAAGGHRTTSIQQSEESFGYEDVIVDLPRSRFNQPCRQERICCWRYPPGADVRRSRQQNQLCRRKRKTSMSIKLANLTRQGRVTCKGYPRIGLQ